MVGLGPLLIGAAIFEPPTEDAGGADEDDGDRVEEYVLEDCSRACRSSLFVR